VHVLFWDGEGDAGDGRFFGLHETIHCHRLS
jgi:hypothetical protein